MSVVILKSQKKKTETDAKQTLLLQKIPIKNKKNFLIVPGDNKDTETTLLLKFKITNKRTIPKMFNIWIMIKANKTLVMK